MKIDALLKIAENYRRFGKMSNPELLWRMKKFVNSLDLPIDSDIDVMFEVIADRLYPEYDGENVTWTETGWITPRGSIDYE